MARRGRVVAGPAALVGALAGVGRHGGDRRRRRGRRRRKPFDVERLTSVIEALAASVPSGRRRRRLLRRARKRIDHLTGTAHRLSTVAGLAAAGVELVSAVRALSKDETDEGSRPESTDAGEQDLEEDFAEDEQETAEAAFDDERADRGEDEDEGVRGSTETEDATPSDQYETTSVYEEEMQDAH